MKIILEKSISPLKKGQILDFSDLHSDTFGSPPDDFVSTEGNDGESFRCETYLKPSEGTVQQAIGWGGMGEGGA